MTAGALVPTDSVGDRSRSIAGDDSCACDRSRRVGTTSGSAALLLLALALLRRRRA